MPDEIIDVDIRENEMFFKINKSKYKIPSKMYPLRSIKTSCFFTHQNTNVVTNELLKKIFNLCTFRVGKCYYNADLLYQLAKQSGLGVEYYAGWLFVCNTPPLHHAWVVYQGNIIDGSIISSMFKYLDQINNSSSNYREDFAEKLINEQKKNISNSEKYIFGRVPEQLIYLGCPDTPEHAEETFRTLTIKFPNHPSYKKEGLNMHGLSKTQELIYQKTLGYRGSTPSNFA